MSYRYSKMSFIFFSLHILILFLQCENICLLFVWIVDDPSVYSLYWWEYICKDTLSSFLSLSSKGFLFSLWEHIKNLVFLLVIKLSLFPSAICCWGFCVTCQTSSALLKSIACCDLFFIFCSFWVVFLDVIHVNVRPNNLKVQCSSLLADRWCLLSI